jgi:hypothetical protein
MPSSSQELLDEHGVEVVVFTNEHAKRDRVGGTELVSRDDAGPRSAPGNIQGPLKCATKIFFDQRLLKSHLGARVIAPLVGVQVKKSNCAEVSDGWLRRSSDTLVKTRRAAVHQSEAIRSRRCAAHQGRDPRRAIVDKVSV